jgi:ATP-dependent RNA helicase SUPV3L1/SUV3
MSNHDNPTLEPNQQNAVPDEMGNSYTLNRARRRLNLHQNTLEKAIEQGVLLSFKDADGAIRISVEDVEALLADETRFEAVAGYERINVREIAEAMNVKTATARKRLRQRGFDHNKPLWSQIRGQIGLATTLNAFRQQIIANREELKRQTRAKREDVRRKREEKKENERRRRNDLRAQLVASFPAWSEIDRSHQLMMLHIGPPNSGKTHEALNRLAEAGEGWYLAPLRLLAWEIFDRLNARGVPCNLLTGEEFIPMEGAAITAATVEMFNPHDPGEVVVIDEAQMIADPDRGWAWTRAMMSCTAPEMHIIGPPTSEALIRKMAEATNMPIGTVYHERLAPIRVADKPWSLKNLPARTILVAFSRKMVLLLKTKLEGMGRTVSVVYGSLPPEVRRKQAERFAAGETEICVATDAVGMGLNLPADHVCFYEVDKFDGRDIRILHSSEVQQIGGRAGRFGISDTGIVGATRWPDLKILKSLFYRTPPDLSHARVAPSVDDLTLIPGSLHERLAEWGRLQSIPQELRASVKTADMAERVELARMLTDFQVSKLGLSNAVQLVNAPTRKSTRPFWYDCAIAIIDKMPMPLPPPPPAEIFDTEDLDYTETCISCADIYLWLAHRKEFSDFAEHKEIVRFERLEWSDRIDEALLSKIRSSYLDTVPSYRRDREDLK